MNLHVHRLFWKFFISFWVSLILFAALVVGVASNFLDHIRERNSAINPFEHVARHVINAQQAADRQGVEGLKIWARQLDRIEAVPILILNSSGIDLLGRPVPPVVIERISRNIDLPLSPLDHPRTHPLALIHLADGAEYRLFPDFEQVTLGRVLQRPRVMAIPVLVAALVSAFVCYVLARYLVSPIERLRSAAEMYSAGDLSLRVGPSLGKRRDEIADLAHAFDRMAERLDILMRSHKQLLTDVSHELRSPLARLQAALGLARQRMPGAHQPELDRIERESERLNELIGQLLSLARLESGMQTAKTEPVDLGEMIAAIVADAALEAQARDCAIQLNNCSGMVIDGVPALLHSAIENVVRNAVSYTAPKTAVVVNVERGPQSEGQVLVRVRDYGPGVPENMLSRVFEPFVRVEDDRARNRGGHGLGLAIAERAVRLHGGVILARNEPDGGLTVSIQLPLLPPAKSKHGSS